MKHLFFLTLLTLAFSSCYFENKIQKQGALDSREPKPESFIALAE